MARSTPWNSGLLFAIVWLLLQTVIWAACLIASAFLSLLLIALLGGTLDPTNWKGH